MDTTKPTLSVIIPAYNRRHDLDDCLRSVFRQDYTQFEVIIIDDGSSDGTAEYLKETFPQVKVLSNSCPLGPSYARNQGIINSNGEIILFLDSDTELMTGDMLTKICGLLQQDRHIGSVGGEIIVKNGSQNVAYGRHIRKDGRSGKIPCRSGEGLKQCDYLATSNCAVRREIALKVGGFDPYYVYGGEDKGFGYLISQNGHKNYVSHEISVLHKFSQNGRGEWDSYQQWSKTTLRFLIKNRILKKIPVLIATDFKEIIRQYRTLIYSILKRVLGRNFGKEQPSYSKMLLFPLRLMAGYVWNAVHLIQALKARGKNFLSPEEMQKYLRTKQK